MSMLVPTWIAILLLLSAAACSPTDTSTPVDTTAPSQTGTVGPSATGSVEPEQVAERLLSQLRDDDYGAAYETLSTGQARDVAANELDLMTKMMSANTLVRDWSLEEPTYFSVDEQSMVEIAGTVTFDDGAPGRARIVMQALGLQADPWRIHEFELIRD